MFFKRMSGFAGKSAGLALALAAIGLSNPASAASLLANGGFETPGIGSYTFYSVGSTALTGWTVASLPGGDPTVQLTNNAAFGGLGVYSSEGSQFLDLTGNVGRGAGIVSDAFATVAGTSYEVSFDVGAFFVAGYGSYGDSIVDLLVNGTKVGSYANVMSLSAPGSDWQRFTYSFIGTGAPTSIGLYSSLSMASGNLGVGLDNVRVEIGVAPPGGVPEPAAWALMIIGFGVSGLSLRRRRAGALAA